jgi:L-fuconolactonase
MSEKIDAHHHLWNYRKPDYEWIGVGMELLARDFNCADLQAAIRSSAIGGTVAVQARQSLDETDWLLDQADSADFIRGVVGWAPLTHPDLSALLERWHGRTKLKGLRHIVQDEPDEEFILRDDFNAGIAQLAQTRLVYDILIYEKHLPATIKFVDQHPNQIFVIDHIAKPRIREKTVEPWRSNLIKLAKREHVFCKISGMVTEADWKNWAAADLRPYLDSVLQAFGPGRLMFGSDWPVCLLACPYENWYQTSRDLLAELSDSEKDQIFGAVATKVYSLDAAAPQSPVSKD